jgi:phasin
MKESFFMNEMPRLNSSVFQMPEAVREFADRSGEQAKQNCEKLKRAADGVHALVEAAYVVNTRGATEYGLKVIEMMHNNSRSAFDVMNKVLTVRSPAEAISVSTAVARQHFDTVTGQIKELSALAQRAAIDGADQIRTGMSEVLRSTGNR